MHLKASEYRTQYTANSDGLITDPGKFEHEMIYVPYFWDKCLEGFADEDINHVFFVRISLEDRKAFPELDQVYGLALEESDNGFVYARTYGTPESFDGAVYDAEQLEAQDNEDE